MKQIVYTYLALIERIEEVHGKLVEPFALKYPSDPRCQYRLNMYYKGEKDEFYNIEPAEDGAYVSNLIGMDVVSVEWDRYNKDKYLTVIVRDETTDEITHEQFEKYLKDHYVSWKLCGKEDIDHEHA